MAGKLKIYAPGRSGVILDLSALDPSMPDNALRSSQNAIHDPTLGRAGALKQRPGFQRFNGANAGGKILGGIPLVVPGTGGAPAAPPGAPIGAPGDPTTTPGDPPNYPATTPALFGAPIVLGRIDNTAVNTGGSGWYASTEGLAALATLLTTPGPPGVAYSYPPTTNFPGLRGRPCAFDPINRILYYAIAHNQASNTQVSVRSTNGFVDQLLVTIPYNTYATTNDAKRMHVMGMWLVDKTTLYLAMKDRAGGQDSNGLNMGRLLKLDLASLSLTEINLANTVQPAAEFDHLVYAVALFPAINALFITECDLNASELYQRDTPGGGAFNVVGVTPDQLKGGEFQAFGNSCNSSCLMPFPQFSSVQANQRLFVGTIVNTAGAAYGATVWMRNRTAVGAASAWSSAKQFDAGFLGVSPVNFNYINSIVEFKGNLYVSHYNPGVSATIAKLVPNYGNTGGDAFETDGFWDGTGTWSVAFQKTSGSIVPYELSVAGNYLYAVGSLGVGGAVNAQVTTDGASWTDVSANLPNTNQSVPLPIFGGWV